MWDSLFSKIFAQGVSQPSYLAKASFSSSFGWAIPDLSYLTLEVREAAFYIKVVIYHFVHFPYPLPTRRKQTPILNRLHFLPQGDSPLSEKKREKIPQNSKRTKVFEFLHSTAVCGK